MDKIKCAHWDCPYKCCLWHEFYNPEAFKPMFWEEVYEPSTKNPETCQLCLDL